MHRRIFLATLLVGLCAGCGPSSASVRGIVTVDGKPLRDGVISFVPSDGKGAPATGNIENGEYDVEMIAGPKRVQISAPVVVGQRKEHVGANAPMVDIRAESLPERYHSKSELTFDVPAGSSTKNWQLETPRK